MERILAKALGQDMSQLAAQEKQLLLTRLLARLAHEIRNPLSSLDIHVQLLEEDLADALPELKSKTSGRLEIIHGELRRLENVVKHFLSLAGPSALELKHIAIADVVNHVCDLLRPEAATRDIEIQASLPANLPTIVADSVQLTQALLNLVINALQAIEKHGKAQVAARLDPDGQFIVLEVSDTGPGIPGEQLSAIFDPFFTTKAEGSGLGLWIVQQIVTAHSGRILARNEPGSGAVFELRLPLHHKERAHG